MKHTNLYYRILYYITGQCGSGKTYTLPHTLEEFKAPWNVDSKFLITTISIDLGRNEIAPILKSVGYTVVIINNETGNGSVGYQLTNAIEEYTDSKKVAIIITHQAYDTFPNELIREKYQLVQDEGSGINAEVLVQSDHKHPLKNYFRRLKGDNLKLTDKGRHTHTFATEQFKDVRNYIINDKRKTVVMTDNSGEFIFDSVNGNRDIEQLTAFSTPTFDYYEDHTIILTASVESCHYYQKHHKKIDITEKNMDSRIKNKEIVFHCHTNKTRNATNFRATNPKFMEAYREWLNDNVGRSLIFANEKDRKHLQNPQWQHIPANVHGSNSYSDYDSIILYGTLNSSPAVMRYKRDTFGQSYDEQYKNGPCEAYHQMIMRTCLRNPDSRDVVNVFVMDMDTAEILKEMFEEKYVFHCSIEFYDDFNNLIKVKRNNYDKMTKRQYNRISTLIKKAEAGKMKNKHVAAQIIALGRKSKSNREILKIDQYYKDKGIKL